MKNSKYFLVLYNISMKKIILCVFTCSIFISLYSQKNVQDSLYFLFRNQLVDFPQEKIYVHTDKPYYLSGEKIWFRAYVTDAVTHIPVLASRYVYVELINPLDSVVTRVKIRPDSLDAFHGHLPVPDDVPEGIYMLRAYTTFMRSQDEHYFFTKTLHIGDPQARAIDISTDFFFESDRRVYATFRFSHAGSTTPLVPQSVMISVNAGKPMEVKVSEDGKATINFYLPASSLQRVMLLEVMIAKDSFKRFIQVPIPDSDFDVSFFPEGGSLIAGSLCRVAFKAVKSNGLSVDISGVVCDQDGEQVVTFESMHQGMGSFSLLAQKGTSYYALCENEKGQTKRFELPIALEYGYALAINQVKGNIHIIVQKPAETKKVEELYLLSHTRGMVQLIEQWGPEKSSIVFPKELFPSGVMHVILFDNSFHIVSERLVFINNEDQGQTTYSADRDRYASRSLVKNSITITNNNGQPLTGSFSVAVTSDREVAPDSTSNILTQLLLTSDLRGHIENPAYYFQQTPRSDALLDLLMRTQGWRRYDVSALAQGHFSQPTWPIEMGAEISGSVKSVLPRKPVEGVDVTAISLTDGFLSRGQTDKEGRFYLSVYEFSGSKEYVVSIASRKGATQLNLHLEMDSYPKRAILAAPYVEVNTYMPSLYADKTESSFADKNNMRTTQLEAAVIVAEREAPSKSPYYSDPDYSMPLDKLEALPAAKDIYDVLALIPSIQMYRSGDPFEMPTIYIRGGGFSLAGPLPPLVLVDNIPKEIETLDLINVNDIAQIDILRGASASIYGVRGAGGAISIYTKDGRSTVSNIAQQLNIKTISVLGHQHPEEFYAPKYETYAQRYNGKPDLRTTIHWQPVVQIDDSGSAAFEFYTADEQISYTVTIEGVANDGTIIRHEGELWRKE